MHNDRPVEQHPVAGDIDIAIRRTQRDRVQPLGQPVVAAPVLDEQLGQPLAAQLYE